MWLYKSSRFVFKFSTKLEYLYGINPVLSALYSDRRKFIKLIISNSDVIYLNSKLTTILNQGKKRQIPIIYASKPKLDSLVQGQPHQNVLLQCEMLQHTPFQQDQIKRPGIYVFVDKVTDPQNFGAILRSCLFFGVQKVIVNKTHNSPLNSTVSKSSAGALQFLSVNILKTKEEQFLLNWKAKQGIIISTHTFSDRVEYTPLHKLSNTIKLQDSKILLVIGSQGTGVSAHIASHSDFNIIIQRMDSNTFPSNFVDSLNVGTALTTILYQITKNIRKKIK